MRIQAYLAESPLVALGRVARQLEAEASHALEAEQLPLVDALVLAALFFESPALVRPSLLAETFATARGTISAVVSRLEARQLIARSIDPEDARSYLLALRPAGRRTALRIIAAFDALQHRFESVLGKQDLRTLLRLAAKLGTNA